MRILILTHSLTGGGAERVASLWARGFYFRGHEVGIVLNCDKNAPQTYRLPKMVKCYNINNWIANKLYRILGVDSYYVCKLRKIVREFCPDIIIGVMVKWSDWAKRATSGMNIPIINTEHNVLDLPDYAPKERKKDLAWRFKRYELFNHITVLTDADIICIRDTKCKVSVLPNPLTYAPLITVPPKDNVILAVGRLDVWHIKGFDILIKSWGKIAANYPTWKLQIAGGGSDKSIHYLNTLVERYNLKEQIEFLGFQQDIQSFYQKASIFVLSSRYEGFGMVLIESMSQGCAPIACDYKGRQREIITSDKEGIICPVDNVKELSTALNKMISDNEYRKMVQHNAIERSKFYSIDNIMNRWEDILQKI